MKKNEKAIASEEKANEAIEDLNAQNTEEQQVEDNETEKGDGADNEEEESKPQKPKKADKRPVITEFIDEILQLNPQYERMYISSKGFVYPEGTPEYQRKNAVLYENKYFNK